jgi:hypothetical protein
LLVMVFSLANSGPWGVGRLEKKEMGSRLILSSGFTKRRVSRRARSHTAFHSGNVATGWGRTASWGAHISSAAPDVKGVAARALSQFEIAG